MRALLSLCALLATASCSGGDTDSADSVRAALYETPAIQRSCAVDADCNDGSACSVDTCVAGRCVNTRRSDDASWALPITPGRESLLGGGTVIDAHFDGEFFLIVWMEGGAVRARRVTASGEPVDATPWSLPEGVVRLAFDGTKYMALRNVTYEPTGSNLIEIGTISKEGNVGPFRAIDLYCRNSNTNCYGADIAYGAGAFVVVYYDAGWRDLTYALYDTSGGLIQRVPLTQWFYQGIGGSSPRAVFDGSRFVLVWSDYRDLTNAASVYATKVNPTGGNRPLANHVGLFVNPGDDTYAAWAPTPTAGKTTHLVTFNGFRDPKQVRLLDSNLNVNPEKVTGVGDQFDSNTRPSFFDGKNYVVSSRTCTTSFYCYWVNRGVYVSRLTEGGGLIDKAPVAIAPGGRYPRFATNRRGKNVAAYDRSGGIYTRPFETCP